MRTVKFGTKQYSLVGTAPIEGNKIILQGAPAGNFEQIKPHRENKYMVLGTFPSADTSVCDMQILKLAEMSEKYTNVDFVTFSMDLPTALNNYKQGHKTARVQLFSDYLTREIAENLGVLIEDLQLCARALFIFDEDNRVKYIQINSETGAQADFATLEKKLEELL
ncbi:redoxin domain-containing protein [Mycoplasma seminis]|uniref:Redoxin domain-containing protein n=1 Tax=Mycoplasma seminis TaxID=512749 RepID=A0ABY9HB98_9MOLU|nr:redoxin domain-containing protein [Mycoplasma seminis]WLP85812.1 redoxin domain-containing protein [Mycoplasma seminis]